MTRVGIVFLTAVWVTRFAAFAHAAPTTNLETDLAATRPTTAPQSQQIDGLLNQLSDPDPAVRTAARMKLIVIGDPARVPLQQAARSDDPQLADAARDVLAAMPWYQQGDPALAVDLLRNYGNGTVADRIGIIGRLGEIIGTEPILLRLLGRESNEDVCWQIVAELRKNVSPEVLTAARQLDPATGGSASDFIAGAAWLTSIANVQPLVDRARGRQLLATAIELDTAAPSYDGGQLDEAFDELVNVAIYHDQPHEALRLRRLQCNRIGINRDAFPSPFFALLAIYANDASLAGMSDDLTKYDRFIARPEALGVLSRTYRRTGLQAMAAALEQCSLDTSLSMESQDICGQCFDRLGFSDLSAAQYRAILARNDRSNDGWDVQARLHLSQLASQREDDAMALSQLQKLLDGRKASDLSESGIQQLQMQATVHQLRIAEAKHDRSTIEQCISTLALDGPADTDTCIEVAPLLRSLGRNAEARQVFDSAYGPLKKEIDAGETDPSKLNEIAWLCARCNMHLEEAAQWAREAVEGRPASSAFLDTNAEVLYRSGKAAEAATLERRALHFDSGDLFMLGQLKRFETAAATQPPATQPAVTPPASAQPISAESR